MSTSVLPGAHALDAREVAGRLDCDVERGLSSAEARARLERHGPNELAPESAVSAWRVLVNQLANMMTAILGVSGLVALAAWWIEGCHGLPSDALVIGAVVALNVALGFLQEYRAERTVQELKKLATATATVLRDGRPAHVDRRELVPGDIVLLDEGDRVPADLRLVESAELRVDESLLTGESAVVPKDTGAVARDSAIGDRTGSAFAGTTVAAGRARGLVVATGATTELGDIARSLADTRSAPTPLEIQLARLSRQIGAGVLMLAVVLAGSLLALQGLAAGSIVHVLMVSVALAVAAVPEGLPTVLTVSLAIGARRLAARHAVVRQMAAVETLGAVTTIVTDKTGTLTANELTAQRIYVDRSEACVTGAGYGPAGIIAPAAGAEPIASAVLELFLAAGVLSGRGDVAVENGRPRPVGDPLDAALVVLAEKGGVNAADVRARAPLIAEAPFTSERRISSAVREWDGGPWVFAKGSLDAIATRVTGVVRRAPGRGFAIEPYDAPASNAVREAEERIAAAGLRVIAIAARPAAPGESGVESETALALVGLVGLGDPLRERVRESVETCRSAGIDVYMLTGDHPRTAAVIARDAGLDAHDALTGAEVEAMTDAELDAALGRTRVCARVSPRAKLRVVGRLMARGAVVAMTGDGVNDAPALKSVHVGVSMGRGGTAVAVEASHVVLLDDDFSTLVTAVHGGRSVYANVQRFIGFLFSGNAGVVLAMFAGVLAARWFGIRAGDELLLPLTAAQILWMNLVTDGAPAVAFSLGDTDPAGMERPPRDPRAPIIDGALWRHVLGTGALIAALLLAVVDAFHAGGLFTLTERGAPYARTAAFFTVVTARLFNAFNFSGYPGSALRLAAWRTWQVPAACAVSWLMTLGLLAWPAARTVFGLVALDPAHLAALTALSATVLLPALGDRKGSS